VNVLVCGGRDYADAKGLGTVLDAMHKVMPFSMLIHGAARGADSLAASWADSRGIPTLPFPADWQAHGKSAGPRRNERMLRMGKPDKVIAFPGGRGTAHMVRIAQEAGVQVITVTGNSLDAAKER
jgi:hypothetical protein